LRSGETSYDEYLLKLRKELFDIHFNSIPTEHQLVYLSVEIELFSSTSAAIEVASVHNTCSSSSLVGACCDVPDGERVTSSSAGITTTMSALQHQDANNVAIAATKKRGRQAKQPGTKKEFQHDWYPTAWLVFLQYGPISDHPHHAWAPFSSRSGGPDTLRMEPTYDRKSLSRAALRKKRRIQIRKNNVKRTDGVSCAEGEESEHDSASDSSGTTKILLQRLDKLNKMAAVETKSRMLEKLMEFNAADKELVAKYRKEYEELMARTDFD